jgi:hypothetical protein
MDRIEGDPITGAMLGALSAAKNKKLTAVIGAALSIIAIVGIAYVGSNAIDTITSGGFSDPSEGRSIQLMQYVFIFMLVVGLVVMVYSLVGYQRDQTKIRESRRMDSEKSSNTGAA